MNAYGFREPLKPDLWFYEVDVLVIFLLSSESQGRIHYEGPLDSPALVVEY